jgi:pyridoxamine 5'-phosphate oxidase
MIEFNEIVNKEPFIYFKECYDDAYALKQKNIEAASLSTISSELKPSSRFINIKYIGKKFIFFSNYKSHKGNDIDANKNICLLFFWNKTNTQIRIEGTIDKSSKLFSDEHFSKRAFNKNISAIISEQSSEVASYKKLENDFELALEEYSKKVLLRPSNWGGYEITPHSFEFWNGSDHRLNKRLKYTLYRDTWSKSYLQP